MASLEQDPKSKRFRLRFRFAGHPDKRREVLNVKNPIRELQSRLYRRVLRKHLKPSPYSHGGVRKRNVKSNAKQDPFLGERQKRIYLPRARVSVAGPKPGGGGRKRKKAPKVSGPKTGLRSSMGR